MLIIKNKLLPIGKNFFAINLCGVLFAKGDCSPYVINHEKIHSRQIYELLILPFYLLYILEWIYRFLQFRNFYKAYKNISFEREAYSNEKNMNYLKNRKLFGFLFYLNTRRTKKS